MAEPSTCPFCGYYSDEYAVQFHIEEHHTEDSPFVHHEDETQVQIDPTSGLHVQQSFNGQSATDESWVKCTREGCGEYSHLSKIDEHLDLHIAISLAQKDTRPLKLSHNHQSPSPTTAGSNPSSPQRNGTRKINKHQRGSSETEKDIRRWQNPFTKATLQTTSKKRTLHRPENPGRLGKKELGPHAFEETMPSDVRKALISGSKPQRVSRISFTGRLVKEMVSPNETAGLIGALADLCALDPTNEVTYLCHSSVRHVEEIACDGDFCGYWNIQMLLTYVQHMNPDGPQQLPDILRIQELIEQAWSNGICSYGQIETGGVLNTRKWIGTHEALAFFNQIGVPVDPLSFTPEPIPRSSSSSSSSSSPPSSPSTTSTSSSALDDLYDYIEAHFLSLTSPVPSSSPSSSPENRDADPTIHHGTSRITSSPPIYLQRAGHSVTVVGLERKLDGTRNLLVFDPVHKTTASMTRLLARKTVAASLASVLHPYRRARSDLRRWKEFEIIVLQPGAGQGGGTGTGE